MGRCASQRLFKLFRCLSRFISSFSSEFVLCSLALQTEKLLSMLCGGRVSLYQLLHGGPGAYLPCFPSHLLYFYCCRALKEFPYGLSLTWNRRDSILLIEVFEHNKLYFFEAIISIMHKHAMRLIASFNCLVNASGAICCLVFQPIPFFILTINVFMIFFMIYIEARKRSLLVDQLSKQAMVILFILVLTSVFFIICSLTTLVYLEQVQQQHTQINPKISALIWEDPNISFDALCAINLFFYFGNFFSVSLYSRAYYRMFWRENIVFIYRYLKEQVNTINTSLLANMPLIPVTDELKECLCSLCLEQYKDEETVTQLACSHNFHMQCVKLWVIRSNCCPLCRKRVIFH